MDQAVVERARGGDREAFANLVSQLQNALIATWQQLPKLRDASFFEAWSRRILVNACYAEFGRRRRFASIVHVIDINGPSSSDEIRILADRDELDRAFRKRRSDQFADADGNSGTSSYPKGHADADSRGHRNRGAPSGQERHDHGDRRHPLRAISLAP